MKMQKYNQYVHLKHFMYLVFARMTGESTAGDSGLCCSVVTSSEHYLTPFVPRFYTSS